MRIYASKTRLAVALGVALCAASWACAPRPRPAPPPAGPPPGLAVVGDDHLAFRVNARLELHAMLAAAARNDVSLAPAFEPSRAPYSRVLASDDDDRILGETIRGLDACFDRGCDLAPLAAHGLDGAFQRAEAGFAPEWDARSRVTWAALERARTAWDPRAEGVLETLARDLGVRWRREDVDRAAAPDARERPSVDLVAESPPAGRRALLTPLLAARGPCFGGDDGRIVDCVLVRALLSGPRPDGFSERFFTVLVVHAVAAVMTQLRPRHDSVDRRAIAAAAPEELAFVTREWHGGRVDPSLERRFREGAARDR